MSHIFSSISIIYNPNSTGSGKKLSQDLQAQLRDAKVVPAATLQPTKYAGHAEKLAYKLAQASARPLIISASGDGGYHEVINGLLQAQDEGATVVAGLLPAGNANDHYHALHEDDIVPLIKKGESQQVDLLQLKTTVKGSSYTRYAHSYIGIGLTPQVGHELNKTKLNRLNELWIVLKVLFVLQPVRIILDGRNRKLDSLIFSNIPKMSKVLSLSSKAKTVDGKFEVTAFYRRNKLKLIASLLRASTTGLVGNEHVNTFTFQTLKPLLAQLDGEIITIDGNVKVSVSAVPRALNCII